MILFYSHIICIQIKSLITASDVSAFNSNAVLNFRLVLSAIDISLKFSNLLYTCILLLYKNVFYVSPS